jgi:hypothetical protein
MKKGDKVQWNWGKGKGTGRVEDVSGKTVKKNLKGTRDNKALTIKQSGGSRVVKLESEVKKASGSNRSKSRKKR